MSCHPSSVTRKSLVVHATGLTWCSFGVFHDRAHYNFDIYQDDFGRCKFLTMWTSYLIFLGTIIGTFVDVYKLFLEGNSETKKQSKLISFRDHFMVVWTILAVLIPILYWGVALVDREGIHPDSLEKDMPILGWFNQYLHTIPVLYVVVSHMIVHYRHPSLKTAVFLACFICTSYTSWLILLGKIQGVYAYPILNTLPPVGFVMFVAGSNILSFVVYVLIRKVDETYWKPSLEKIE